MIAYIFPGQGSQQVGMGRDLAEQYPAARAVFAEADDALGFALSRLCFEGPAADLQLTENTQPAILTTSVAALRAMEAEGFPPPDFVAGHSLGEYSALIAAGSLLFATAVRMVRARGRYMQEAVPNGVGAMAAVLGAEPELIEQACMEAAQDEVCSAANINSPKQTVIAGHAAAVERAIEIMKARGVRKVVKLNVSAPFHSALMQPAQERLAADLALVDFSDLRVPLITNVDALTIRLGGEASAALVRQVSAPVRWQAVVERLVNEHGVDTFVEVGPGKVLSGLVRQIAPNVRCVNVEDAASLGATHAVLADHSIASGNSRASVV